MGEALGRGAGRRATVAPGHVDIRPVGEVLAHRLVADLGTIVVVGPSDDGALVIPSYYLNIIVKESTIVGISTPSLADWNEALALVRRGAIDDPMLSCLTLS